MAMRLLVAAASTVAAVAVASTAVAAAPAVAVVTGKRLAGNVSQRLSSLGAAAAFLLHGYTLAMDFQVRVATAADIAQITALIGESVRGLQGEYTAEQREAALRTVFTVDSRLVADGTYFVALAENELAGCGGWSFRRTLYGGDHQVERVEAARLDPAVDAAKVRAIFVHPRFARMGLGSLLLQAAEDAALAAGFRRFEMGSTLAGVALYTLKGYSKVAEIQVPVGDGLEITVVRMEKRAK